MGAEGGDVFFLKTEKKLSKFQTDVTFEVILIINQNFNTMFESSYCSRLQIIKIFSQVKIKFNFRLKYFLS